MLNNKGQGLIESVLVLPVMMVALSSLMLLIYWGGVNFYASYRLEEALLCAASPGRSYSCESQLKSALSSVLLFHESFEAHIAKSSTQVRGLVQIHVHGFKSQSLQQEQILKLPLEKNL